MKAKLRAKENNCGMNMYVVCERIYILGENEEMYRNVSRFCDSVHVVWKSLFWGERNKKNGESILTIAVRHYG